MPQSFFLKPVLAKLSIQISNKGDSLRNGTLEAIADVWTLILKLNSCVVTTTNIISPPPPPHELQDTLYISSWKIKYLPYLRGTGGPDLQGCWWAGGRRGGWSVRREWWVSGPPAVPSVAEPRWPVWTVPLVHPQWLSASAVPHCIHLHLQPRAADCPAVNKSVVWYKRFEFDF